LATWPDVVVDVVEAKTDASDGDEWGEENTDEIPVYYRVQVMWAMDVLGLRRARFGVLTSRLQFRRFVVDYDEHDAELMRTAGRDFMHSLELGDEPDIDESTSTYRAMRQLHPDIEDVEVEVPQHIADRFRAAVMIDRNDERRRQLETTRVAQEMGAAHFAKDPKGVRFAARVAKGDAAPYIQLAGPKKQWERSLIAS
jgi:predicted phage-related endonuclease